jgi:hypothetical protein
MDLQTTMNEVNVYFGQLNDYEKYAWVVGVLGFILVIMGIILLF